MPSPQSVYRRSSGIYVVRLVVPTRLRPFVGKGEIHISTGMRQWRAAQLDALRIQGRLRSYLMSLDTLLRLEAPGRIRLTEAAQALHCSHDTLLDELLNLEPSPSLHIHVSQLTGWQIADLAEIESVQDDAGTVISYVIDDAKDKGLHVAYTGFLELFAPRVAIAELANGGSTPQALFRLESGEHFMADPCPDLSAGDLLISRQDILDIFKRCAPGYRAGTAQVVEVAQSVADVTGIAGDHGALQIPGAHPSIAPAHTGQTYQISHLATMMRERLVNLKPDSHRRRDTEVGYFISLMGDVALNEIDYDLVNEFASQLKELPTNLYLADRKANSLGLSRDLKDLAEIVTRGLVVPKSWPQVQRHLRQLSEVFAFAVREGLMRSNPASGYRIPRVQKTPDHEARDRFDDADLQMIFSQDWFVAGRPTTAASKPFHYWLPLIGLFTGARLGEIAQLYLDDVRKISEVWTFRFDEVSDEGDKSIKTAGGVRTVPLHSQLLRLGLLDYVNALRAKGETRLFPELRRDDNKGYAKDAGRWFNDHFLGRKLGIPRDGKKVFHSFRHTFMTLLNEAECPHDSREFLQLVGHERGTTIAAQRYIKDREMPALKRMLESVNFPDVSRIAPFDVQRGVRSALRLKTDREYRMRNKG